MSHQTPISGAVFFMLFCFLCFTAFPQPIGNLMQYSGEKGPSHRSVSNIIKDKDGFMWFGTWDGINRFDGYTFKSFDPFHTGNKFILQSRRIVQVLDDRDSRLWILTYDKQVYWFDKKTEEFHSLSPFLQRSLGNVYPLNRIFMAKGGFVWLGTEKKGVIAFCYKEQMNIVHYREDAKPPYKINSDDINILRRDDIGNIWIGTSAGLNQLHKENNKYIAKPATVKNNEQSVRKSAKGNWGLGFVVGESRILLLQKGRNNIDQIAIEGITINSILFSKFEDFLYVTSNDGSLYRVDLSTKTHSRLVRNEHALYSMFEDSRGNLWVEQNQGVIYLQRNTSVHKVFRPLHPERSSIVPFYCFEDINQRVWISMKGGGFGYYDEADRKIRFSIEGPGAETVNLPQYNSNFFYDPAGVAWFSSEEKGLVKLVFPNTNFRHHQLFLNGNKILNDEARSMMLDSKGRLWVGTKAGQLYIRAGETVSRPVFVNLPPGGLSGIYSLLEDKSGDLWIGTKSMGLFNAKPQKDDTYLLKQYPAPDLEANAAQIYALVQDNQQNVWVGTFNDGLYKLEQGFGNPRLKKVPWPDKPTSKRSFTKIRHLLFDGKGNLWIATTEGLVIHAPNGHTSFYFDTPPDNIQLGDNDIQYIFSDKSGAMYLCTSGGGLTKVEGDPSARLAFTNFGKKQGLSNGFILSGIADREGSIWLSTEGGLVKYDAGRNSFYNIGGGGNSLDELSFSEKTVGRSNENHLFWGTRKGYLEFSPEDFNLRMPDLNLVFTRLLINNTEQNLAGKDPKINIQYVDGLVLSHNQNNLSIDFAVTDFRSGQHNFSYRLLNFDSVWHQNGSLNRATFTNLKPGKYQLEVKSEHDFYESALFRTLPVTILPPWWATWWAYSAYLILLISLLALVRHFVKSIWLLKQRVAIEQKLADMKMRFFTNVSHELRTPLTLIMSPAEQLLKSEPLSEEGQEFVRLINKNAGRMQRFVDQLLELRQIQENKYTLNKSRVDLVALIRQILEGFHTMAKNANITLRDNLREEPLYLNIDKENIEIVLYNLLSNAFKYSYPDSEVMLTLTIDQAAGMICVAVLDEGPGVKKESLSEIFELFHAGAISSSKVEKSSGIGLSLAKELVQLHGGHIEARNRVTGGLEVAFTLALDLENDLPGNLPATQKRVNSSVQALSKDDINEELGKKGPGDQILVVEDNDELRSFLVSQLKGNYEVLEADSGNTGLSIAKETLPDLIVSDVMMPGMDGIELVRQLRGNRETSHIPIILLSAKQAIETQIQGLEYGADYYITKPFHLDFLLASVQNLLTQRKRLFDLMLDRRDLLISHESMVITNHDSQFLKDVISVVEDMLTDSDLSIDKIADALNMGRNTFYKKFKSLTNMAPVEFVRDMRLQKAKVLIDNGAENMSEVAYQAGFSNPKYFSTCFKEKFGLSPKAYFQEKHHS